VVDVHETPAVPPFDPKGDVRAGYFIAGGLLVALGWGFGVVANVLLHAMAGSAGMSIRVARITSTLGPFALATFLFGLFAGAFGVVLMLVGRTAPEGPTILPGYDY